MLNKRVDSDSGRLEFEAVEASVPALRKRVLVVSGDSLGAAMAGPAIRAFEIAKSLSSFAEVRLISTVRAEMTHPDFEISFEKRKSLNAHVKWCDIVIFQGALLSIEPWIARTNKILISDLYDPIHIESLEQQKSLPPILRYLRTLDVTSDINRQIRRADFFICASEKQRDLWLGQLGAMGRLNGDTYDQDSSLRRLIDVVPFGVQDAPPDQTKHLIRGEIPGIETSDKVLIWGGGIYNWFDPLTLIRAVGQVAVRRRNLRLVFMGTVHPNPRVPEMRMLMEARNLAHESGLLNSHVFFMEGWVPYHDRANALMDADVGVSTHLDHLETAFSFRTRILDYLWAGLPIIATRGDTFEKVIEGNGLGLVVQPGDVEELSHAIEELLYEESVLAQTGDRVRHFASNFHWASTLQPLVEYVRSATRAADSNSGFPKLLNKFDRSNPGALRRRLMLYRVSIQRFGLVATATFILSNVRKRLAKVS